MHSSLNSHTTVSFISFTPAHRQETGLDTSCSISFSPEIETNARNSDDWHHGRYEMLTYDQLLHQTRQQLILTVIRALYQQSGVRPTIKRIKENISCHPDTAKAALAMFDAELQAQQTKQDLLIYVNEYSQKHHLPINPDLQTTLDNATYALQARHPKQTYLLTLVTPGTSEEAYLAVAINSQSIAEQVIASLVSLLPEGFHLDYLYAWEIQHRLAPHLHIFLNLPTAYSITRPDLKDIWISTINDIGRDYNINMFANDDGTEYSEDDPYQLGRVADIKPFTQFSSSCYEHTYLGKSNSKEPRELKLATYQPVAFAKWGDVSADLKSYADTLPFADKIPLNCINDADDLIDQTMALIDSITEVVWKEITRRSQSNGLTIRMGYKTMIFPSEFQKIKEQLSDHVIGLLNRKHVLPEDKADHFLSIKLQPTGKLTLVRYTRPGYLNKYKR